MSQTHPMQHSDSQAPHQARDTTMAPQGVSPEYATLDPYMDTSMMQTLRIPPTPPSPQYARSPSPPTPPSSQYVMPPPPPVPPCLNCGYRGNRQYYTWCHNCKCKINTVRDGGYRCDHISRSWIAIGRPSPPNSQLYGNSGRYSPSESSVMSPSCGARSMHRTRSPFSSSPPSSRTSLSPDRPSMHHQSSQNKIKCLT